MKYTAIISLLAILFVGSTALAQEKSCSLELAGTWKAQVSTQEARLYRFDSDGGVVVLSVTGNSEPREIARGSYELDDPKTPKSISLKSTGKNRIFGRALTAMKVVSYDDSSITCVIPGVGETRWTRVDPNRYFLVLSARTDEFYDHSGSALQAVIKLAEGVPTIDAFGIYPENKQVAFGAIPPAVLKDHFREARKDSETTLRLEINSRQYERALKIIKEWQRRVREGAVLYGYATDVSEDPASLNNILVVKAITETLNQCSEDVDLYKLNYIYPEDWIADRTAPAFIPFVYFKELRRRNEARHIPDQKFQELVQIPNVASR